MKIWRLYTIDKDVKIKRKKIFDKNKKGKHEMFRD